MGIKRTIYDTDETFNKDLMEIKRTIHDISDAFWLLRISMEKS